MGKLSLTVMALGAAMSFGALANAQEVKSNADCEYEGGEIFSLPTGAEVCVIQIRGEEYHGEEYDGAQLGVKVCDGEVIGDGLFCKVTLKEAPAPVETPLPQGGAAAPQNGVTPAAGTSTPAVGGQLIDNAKDKASNAVKEKAKKILGN